LYPDITIPGPSRRRENTPDQPQRTKVFSKYGVNERGDLEMIETDDHIQPD